MSGFERSAFAGSLVRIKSTGAEGITTGLEITHRLQDSCSLRGGTWIQLWEVGVLLPGGRVAVVPVADTEDLPGCEQVEALFEALVNLESATGIVPDKQARLAALRERIAAQPGRQVSP